MNAAHGLVIGKFYPPHEGHRLLIRTAAATSNRVTVVVMAASAESLPIERRVAWLREIHATESNVTVVGIIDDVRVDYEDDAIWRAHVDAMRAAVASVTRVPVDAVFTSEPYGDELWAEARRKTTCRSTRRASSCRSRRAPFAPIRFVRGDFCPRACAAGSAGGSCSSARSRPARRRWRECSWIDCAHEAAPSPARGGCRNTVATSRSRSWLSRGLRRLWRVRPFRAMEDLVWRTQDFIDVAREQQRREDDAARESGPVLVCDTDAFATGVWHERYLSARSADVESIAAEPTWPTRFYLLTDPDDVPFVQDGLRDGVAIRRWMTSAFVERLSAVQARWEWIRGGGAEARTVTALAALDAWLGEPWPMAGPGSTGP